MSSSIQSVDISQRKGNNFVTRYMKYRPGMVGLITISGILLLALLAPVIAPYNPNALHPDVKLTAPNRLFILGTDEFGRDIFSRLLYGTRVTLLVVFIAQTISSCLGIFLGLFAGWCGGWVDNLIMRIADALLAIPGLMFLIVWGAILDSTMESIFFALGLISWSVQARLMRGQVLALKSHAYIDAAQIIGMSNLRIVLCHILPNAIGTSIALATLSIGGMIITEASLSFLGLGIPIPDPSLGRMIYSGGQRMASAWWYAVFPGLVVMLMIIGFNLIGDGIQYALNPRFEMK